MECPKCHFEHPLQTSECMKCGVVFAKCAAEEAAAPEPAPQPVPAPERPLSAEELHGLRQKGQHELLCRVFALPGALLFGWLVAKITPMPADFLRMWAHEGGHAVTAWLCGYVAIPTGWFTIVMPERHRGLGLLLAAALIFGGYVAWRVRRWFWVSAAGTALVFLLAGTTRTDFQAQGLIIFGGDAGCFVLGTIAMATFYARPDSAMYRKQLRWGLLLLGAIAFMDAYATWSGGFEKIVGWIEDTDERGPSDLFQLTQMYGWKIGEMQARFLRVAHLGFAALAAMYGAGLVAAKQRQAALPPEGDLAVAKSAVARAAQS